MINMKNSPGSLKAVAVLLSLGIAGCATTGPSVSQEEMKAARLELQIKSLLRTAEQQQRVWGVGYALLEDLGPEAQKGPYPDDGLVLTDLDETSRHAFGFSDKQRGSCVLAVREGGPAAQAGLAQADLLLSVDGRSVSSSRAFLDLIAKRKPGDTVQARVRRGEEELEFQWALGSIPRDIRFYAVNDKTVNAWTDGRSICVTHGMMQFVDSDDELAVVLGHELAHVTSSHIKKSAGIGLVSAILVAAAEIAVSGAGDVLRTPGGWVQASFSREYEREADYRGALSVYKAGYDVAAGITIWEKFGTDIPESLTADLMSTHPCSPERLVRLRKVAESLQQDGLEGTIAKYETPPSA